MDCREVQRSIQTYLDDEFVDDDRVAYAAHLQICEPCRRVASFEQGFRERLRGAVPQLITPPAFKARLRTALEENDRRFWEHPLARYLLPVAAAMAMVFGGWFFQRRAATVTLSELAQASINWHRREVPMDVKGAKAESIQRFFSDKVPFAVRPPSFGRLHAQLLGARLSNLREHQAAYLVYRAPGGRRVSVFIVDQNAMPTREREKLFWHHVGGYQAVIYRRNGMAYAVASDMDRRQLANLIVDFP